MSDPDDWFGGARADDDAGDAGDASAEDWLHDVDRTATQPWYEAIDRRIVIVAVVCIGLLIAVLAAAGVFSGGGHTATPPVAVTTVASTPAPATTAPAPVPLPAPTTPLKPHDTGAQVKVLQRALSSLGFSTGKIDGDYGPATEAAVKEFQRAKGLDPDGVAGTATVRALKAALSAQ